MEKNPTSTQGQIPTKHPYEKEEWSTLNDVQKTQLLLNSFCLLDTDVFTSEFISWESPEINSGKLK